MTWRGRQPTTHPPLSASSREMTTEPASPVRPSRESAQRLSLVGYPRRFELALKFANEGPLKDDESLTDSDRLLLDALTNQACFGSCTEGRPMPWDQERYAKWSAWSALGNLSNLEAMVKLVQAVEELAPAWMEWPPLGIVEDEPEEEAADAEASAEKEEAAEPEEVAGVAEEERWVRWLDERLSRRSRAPPLDAQTLAADAALVRELSGRLAARLDAPPRARQPQALQSALHCLACLTALGTPARKRSLDEGTGALALAVRAARPASSSDTLELPMVVQHLGLMVLVNVSLDEEGPPPACLPTTPCTHALPTIPCR